MNWLLSLLIFSVFGGSLAGQNCRDIDDPYYFDVVRGIDDKCYYFPVHQHQVNLTIQIRNSTNASELTIGITLCEDKIDLNTIVGDNVFRFELNFMETEVCPNIDKITLKVFAPQSSSVVLFIILDNRPMTFAEKYPIFVTTKDLLLVVLVFFGVSFCLMFVVHHCVRCHHRNRSSAAQRRLLKDIIDDLEMRTGVGLPNIGA